MTTDDAGTARVSPDELREFGSKVHNVNQAISDLQQALNGLGGEHLATGSGQDNEAITGYYRGLIGDEAAPATQELAGQLEQMRDAVHANADDWENHEKANREAFQG